MAVTLRQQAVSGPGRVSASRSTRPARLPAIVCRAQGAETHIDRRAVLGAGLLAGSVPLLTAAPAFAAYGDSANVFGRVTNRSGFVPYVGDGFALLLPAKWNPSREREFPDIVLRYQDNFDLIGNLIVVKKKADKASLEAYGTPEAFLKQVTYLLGQQSFDGETLSEGGFDPGRVSAASVLDIGEATDRKGRLYYTYEVLTRTADGDEGGKHHLFKAAVSEAGDLWILKVMAGDKRWFKGADKEARGVIQSFTLA